MNLRIYNSLTKKIEDFQPINPDRVTMYTCGPTVYDYVHIGNWRTYMMGDILFRTLQALGYTADYVMNLTDVGHLTGDNAGDADTGDDRLEKSAEKEGKSARDIADYYIEDFLGGFKQLNLKNPRKFARATDYIDDQISLVKTLEEGGYTYELEDGIYFDTSKFPAYSELSGQDLTQIREGARVPAVSGKKNPSDFAVWKFSPVNDRRWQEWDSPWGVGFPGWHLECSAMIIKELGETIDFHLGGEDLKSIHHPNEIAQSECATGKKFVNYWVHGAFLQVSEGKMSKSAGTGYTLEDIRDKGYEPLALRYLYMTANYRSKLNFTWEALSNAQNSLKKLYDLIGSYKEDAMARVSSDFYDRFLVALGDDLNTPRALAVLWDLLKSDIPEPDKLVTIVKMDEVLGLHLEDYVGYEIPQKIQDLAKTRYQYRKAGIWDKADLLRKQILEMGYIVEDKSKDKYRIKRKI